MSFQSLHGNVAMVRNAGGMQGLTKVVIANVIGVVVNVEMVRSVMPIK